MNKAGEVTLGFGSGGELYHQLVAEMFLPAFANPYLAELADAALCPAGNSRIAVTCDGFVVKPRFFPGGDIGRLAVCGTVNDLAMSGARPLYLTTALIIEAGFPLTELQSIVDSMAAAAREAGVLIVSGDTKVVDKGACDGLFITTSGVGLYERETELNPRLAQPGDKIIVSGEIASHGMAVMAARHHLDFAPPLASDVAPLASLAAAALKVSGVKLMRDPTRGGIAATLNEWAAMTGLPILIEEAAVPLAPPVAAACELLGIDPFYVANEGKMLLLTATAQAKAVLAALRAQPQGKQAAIIGELGRVGEDGGGVFARTRIGSKRIVGMIDGEQLPRIC
jgi:hydrogenase expression/formation protein HypE